MKVSIITPCYNGARFIGEMIESVQAQTHSDWELLITDDCSTDASAEIVAAYAKRDPRIELIRSPRNGGPAAARNQSLSKARGDWIAFLDCDDLWLPLKLETQLRWMRERQVRFTYTGYRRMSEDGTRVGHPIGVPKHLNYRSLLGNTAITTSTALLDRRLLDGLQLEPGWGYDDFVLWLSILKKGEIAQGIPDDLVRYRVVAGSVSRRWLRSAQWVWRIYREHERLNFWRSTLALLSYGIRARLKHRQ